MSFFSGGKKRRGPFPVAERPPGARGELVEIQSIRRVTSSGGQCQEYTVSGEQGVERLRMSQELVRRVLGDRHPELLRTTAASQDQVA